MKDMIISWALSRLNEQNTWAGLLGVLAAKLGVHFSPAFDTLTINCALGAVALLAYVIKGGPVIIKKGA